MNASAIADTVAHYDYLGGLGNDTLARRVAAESFAAEERIPVESAYELLADALARRAASHNLVLTE